MTHIIHNAWRVDFNLALTSFESNVKGVRRLVDFALTSPQPLPPHLAFTSSIGVFRNVQGDEVQAEIPLGPEIAVSTGYAESKWVSEHILYKAVEHTPLKALVVRVGQVCGGLDGAWNKSEWFPSLVQASQKLGYFPEDNGVVSWIPPEITADALIDFRKTSGNAKVVHLIHPRPVPWSSISKAVSSELSVTLVPYVDWLAKLEHAASSISPSASEKESRAEVQLLRDLQALRLLPFFKGIVIKGSSSGEAMGFPSLAVTKALEASPTLANPSLRQLGVDDVKRWLAYWRKVDLLV